MAIGFVLITTVPGDEERVRTALDSIEHVTDRWMLFGENVRVMALREAILRYRSVGCPARARSLSKQLHNV